MIAAQVSIVLRLIVVIESLFSDHTTSAAVAGAYGGLRSCEVMFGSKSTTVVQNQE